MPMITNIIGDSQGESDLCSCDDGRDYEYDYELVEDIRGRMILHWNYRNLKEIPLEVLDHGEHIEEIYLKRNCLEKLPSNIGKLTNLTNLYLQGNQLEELPNEIGDLRCLRVLDVSLNYIRRLPSSIGELKLLQNLLLTYNQLEELPRCLKHLHHLKQLELSGNRIHSLPDSVIHGLHSLEELGIDRNPISFLPRNLCLLRNLRYFSACRCNLLLLPSLPFQSLLCRSNNTPPSHLTRRQQARNNNNNMQLLFDGNPRLNYVPYWVFQLLGSSVECFGCGLDPGESDNAHHPNASTSTQLQLYTYHTEVNRPRVKLRFRGKLRTLHFDQDLLNLHHCGLSQEGMMTSAAVVVAIPTLYEICLRKVYQYGILEESSSSSAHDDSYASREPVQEPLIVPQRAGQHVINMRGELEKETAKKSDDDEKRNPPLASTDSRKEDDQSVGGKSRSSSASASTAMTKPSLVENKDAGSLLLPSDLSRILMSGPVAKCFQCLTPIFTESWPIIFQIPGWVWNEHENNQRRDAHNNADDGDGVGGAEPNMDNHDVRGGGWERRRDGDMEDAEGKLNIGCAHFCSDSCINRFRKGTRFSSNLVMNDLRCMVENELVWVAV